MKLPHVVFKHCVIERVNRVVRASSNFPAVFWWWPPAEAVTCLACIAEST